MAEREKLYRKFQESGQEKLRLEIALQEFSGEAAEGYQTEQKAYGDYIRRRIRPAVELLMDRGDLEKIEKLAGYGWITEKQLEEFIQKALRQDNRAVLFCLLHLKNRTTGFHDREFLL